MQELAVRLGPVSEELTARLRRAPTPGELAEHCGSSIEQVLEALATETAHRPVSIDRPREEDGDGLAVQLGADDDAGYTRVEEASVVESLLDALPERERTILRLRFEQELTQREIGKRIGMSQMQVSRLIRRSIAALHASATQPSGPDGAAKSATGRGMNDDDKPVPEVRDADRSRVPPAG